MLERLGVDVYHLFYICVIKSKVRHFLCVNKHVLYEIFLILMSLSNFG